MSQRLRPYFLTGILLVITSTLGALLTGEWLHLHTQRSGKPLPERSVSAPIPETDLTPDTFALPGVTLYQQMAERPLFMESRRPAPPASAEPPPPPPPEKAGPINFKVMGILATPEGRMALIADAKGKYKRMKVKDSLDGWHISDIKPDRLLLEQGGFKEDLSLLKKRPKGAAMPQASAPSNTPTAQPARPANSRLPNAPIAAQPPAFPQQRHGEEITDDMGEPPPSDESGMEEMDDMGERE